MRLLSAYLITVVFANAKPDSKAVSGLGVSLNAKDDSQNVRKEGDKCNLISLNNIVCENDSLVFCGPNNQIMSMRCAVNGRQGFCNCEKTACVPEKPVCQDEITDCLQPGMKLPNNLDCHSYTFCTKDSKKLKLVCPGNLIFNPNFEKCMDRNTAQCRRIVCPRPGNMPQLIPFPQARNYYVLCYKGMGDVRKCPDKYYSVQNNACRYDCKLRKDSGVFKDTNLERCQKGVYYACRKEGNNFITVEAKCPPNLTFDEKLELCMEGDNCSNPETRQRKQTNEKT